MYQTDIIDSRNYRKYKTYRAILFSIAFISLIPYCPGNSQAPPLLAQLDASTETWTYFIVFSATAWMAYISFAIYTYKAKKIGTITIREKSITINKKDSYEEYLWDDLNSIKMMIKTRYTKPETIFGYSGNNWIEINEKEIHEFKIESYSRFKKLDTVVQMVNKKKKIIRYVAIMPRLKQIHQ